jgi:hypothetical protein
MCARRSFVLQSYFMSQFDWSACAMSVQKLPVELSGLAQADDLWQVQSCAVKRAQEAPDLVKPVCINTQFFV